MESIKNFIKKIVFHFIKPPVQNIYNSYSQAGEDGIINFLFEDKKIIKPTYFELGANVPDEGNNTFRFYNAGSTGVLVEADASLIDIIKEKRPKDVVLNYGVTFTNLKQADFYVFEISALNTFSKEEALNREKNGSYKIVKTVSVPLKTINELINENFDTYPDLLSIDIEGLDLQVLQSLDYDKYPIPVICAETCTYSENHIRPKDNSIADFLLTKDYFIYADTYINTIFVNRTWFFKQ